MQHAVSRTPRTSVVLLSRGFGFLLLGFAAFLTLGCGSGGGDSSKNEVTGKVTLGDKPVSGIVSFVYSDNKEISAPTNAEGVYTMINPTAGTVKVAVKALPGATTVAPDAVKGKKDKVDMPGAGEGPTTTVGGGTPPPPKYGNPATSTLTYEVKAGKHTYDIPLSAGK